MRAHLVKYCSVIAIFASVPRIVLQVFKYLFFSLLISQRGGHD